MCHTYRRVFGGWVTGDNLPAWTSLILLFCKECIYLWIHELLWVLYLCNRELCLNNELNAPRVRPLLRGRGEAVSDRGSLEQWGNNNEYALKHPMCAEETVRKEWERERDVRIDWREHSLSPSHTKFLCPSTCQLKASGLLMLWYIHILWYLLLSLKHTYILHAHKA